jgi:hypothetical protein
VTLADRFADGDVPVPPQKFRQHAEFDETGGTASTGPIRRMVTDYRELLTLAGLDPETFRIVGKVSQWTKTHHGKEDTYSFLFTFEPISTLEDDLDLPALYAEVARTKHRPLKPRQGGTLVVCWADIQTGKVDHLGNTSDLLIRLDEKRALLEQHLKRNPVSGIVVADVGDIVEGIENTSSQLATNDLSLMDQVDIAATEFWKTIRTCAKYAPVDVLSIPSNHAQLRRGKGLIGKPTDDWGLHISRRLERMNEEAGLPVTFHRPADWHETLVFDVRGTRLGLAHGHQASAPSRVTEWWAKMTHAGVMECDVLLTGHYHFPSIRPSGRNMAGRSRWHLQAPTLDNGSAWVANTMGEDGDPGLMTFVIDDRGFSLQSLTIL